VEEDDGGAGDAEDGGVCGDNGSGSSSRAASGFAATVVPRTAPHLLHLLPNLDVTGSANREQTPIWLGFWGEAPAAALIAGGR
jgi:hypothetical protein